MLMHVFSAFSQNVIHVQCGCYGLVVKCQEWERKVPGLNPDRIMRKVLGKDIYHIIFPTG